jgi:hypothetical protein
VVFFLEALCNILARRNNFSRCLLQRFPRPQLMRVHLLTAPGILVIWVVTHPSTNRAQHCLTSVFKWVPAIPSRDLLCWKKRQQRYYLLNMITVRTFLIHPLPPSYEYSHCSHIYMFISQVRFKLQEKPWCQIKESMCYFYPRERRI